MTFDTANGAFWVSRDNVTGCTFLPFGWRLWKVARFSGAFLENATLAVVAFSRKHWIIRNVGRNARSIVTQGCGPISPKSSTLNYGLAILFFGGKRACAGHEIALLGGPFDRWQSSPARRPFFWSFPFFGVSRFRVEVWWYCDCFAWWLCYVVVIVVVVLVVMVVVGVFWFHLLLLLLLSMSIAVIVVVDVDVVGFLLLLTFRFDLFSFVFFFGGGGWRRGCFWFLLFKPPQIRAFLEFFCFALGLVSWFGFLYKPMAPTFTVSKHLFLAHAKTFSYIFLVGVLAWFSL